MIAIRAQHDREPNAGAAHLRRRGGRRGRTKFPPSPAPFGVLDREIDQHSPSFIIIIIHSFIHSSLHQFIIIHHLGSSSPVADIARHAFLRSSAGELERLRFVSFHASEGAADQHPNLSTEAAEHTNETTP